MVPSVYCGDGGVFKGDTVRGCGCIPSVLMTLASLDANVCGCRRFQLSPNRYLKVVSSSLDGAYLLPKTSEDATYCVYENTEAFTGCVIEVYADASCTGTLLETITAVSWLLFARYHKANKNWEASLQQFTSDSATIQTPGILALSLFAAFDLDAAQNNTLVCTATTGDSVVGSGATLTLSRPA